MTSPDWDTPSMWAQALKALRQQLESYRRAGVAQLPRPPVLPPLAGTEIPVEPEMQPAPSREPRGRATEPQAGEPARERLAGPPPRPAPATAPPPSEPGRENIQVPVCRVTALEVMQREVSHCARCAQLASTRTQTVFGVGNPEARLCFLGEAPGADEDRQGEPFVGAAGQLLNKILAAMGLRREDVYILNVLKCRPPQNRTPSPDETANCRSFMERQLDIIQPEFLCCLGATAAQALLRTTQPLGRLRGRFHDYRGIRVLATYHPAYLLRYPDMKRETWEDMKLLMREMGLTPPGR